MTSVRSVRIGKTVDYKTLEKALVDAAEEVGWKVKLRDEFRRDYKLGSVKEVKSYESTCFLLRGKLLPAMRAYVYGKFPIDTFYIWMGFPCGFTSKKKIEQYLDNVSKNLPGNI